MKKLTLLFAACFAVASAIGQVAQGITLPPSGDNQKSRLTQWIGPVEVTITYNSPNVTGPNGQDRKGHIWGELVHYGYINQGFGTATEAPWRAGANENTTITVSHDVVIQGKTLKAGTYGLFLGVAKEGAWTWIFSKNSTSWGSYFYDQNEDALRVEAQPQDAPYAEFLAFGFDDRLANSATAYLHWENKKVPLKIDVPNVNDLYVAILRNEFKNAPGFNPQNFQTAAAFCASKNTNLEEALTWVDQSMNPFTGGSESFFGLSVKAQVLTAMGRTADAAGAMDKAIKLPSTTVQQVHQYARTLLSQGQKEKAMEVFQYNFKAHPEEKFTTYVGLARGYTAMGDKKNAIKNWEVAIKNIPENQKQFISTYEGEVKKLKEGK